MYIDFVEFFFCKLTSSIFLKKNSKKFVNRNENVVPLLMEMRNEFLKKLKTSFHFQISRRDLTISDVAHAQQSESELSLPSLNRNIALRNQDRKIVLPR